MRIEHSNGGRPRRRTWSSKLAAVLVAIVLSLVAIEAVLAFFMGNFDIASFDLDPGDGRCIGLRPNSESHYTGYMWRVPTAVHGVNAMGYRGAARPEQPAPSVVRVAALGDSFTYGVGVDDGDSLPAALERELGGAGAGVEVLNFGIPGHNIDEVIDQYVYFARRWNPRAAIYFVVNNDLDEGLCRRAKSHGWIHIGRYWRTMRLFVAVVAPSAFWNPPIPHPDDEARFKAGLARLRDEVARDGAILYVVSFKDPLHDAAAMNRIVAELGIPSHILSRDEFDSLEVIPNEGHFTARGNETAAVLIAPGLSAALQGADEKERAQR